MQHPFISGFDLLYDIFCLDEHDQYLKDSGLTDSFTTPVRLVHEPERACFGCMTMARLYQGAWTESAATESLDP